MTNDALVLVFARNAFYKRLHYLVLATLALSILVIGILVWVLIYLIRHPTEPFFFATDSIGRLIHVIPVKTPNMSLNAVEDWTINAVQDALSFDFINYRAQMQSTEKYFTTYGWTNYMKALTLSNNLTAVLDRKMVGLAQVVDQPKVIAEGILGGAYAYKFEMPVLITYLLPPFDNKSSFANPAIVSVIVQRQPILQSDHGLGIVQLITKSAATGPSQPQSISGTAVQ